MAASNAVRAISSPTVPVDPAGPHPRQTELSLALKVGSAFVTESRVVTTEKRDYFTKATGDDNKLHDDPAAAHVAGFDQPIAHGIHVQAMAVELIRLRGLELLASTPVVPVLRSNGLKFVKDVRFGEEIHAECVVTQLEPLPRGFLIRLKVSVHTPSLRVQHGQVTFLLIPVPSE